MALPHDEWLHLAKGVPVGSTDRHKHRRESRPNLIVGNDADRWWCFCQACKQGGVVMKEFVKVTGTPAPPRSTDIALPDDIVPLHLHDKPVQDGVLGFLASKNMDAMYIPEIAFSDSRKRIMVRRGPWDGWLGRDSTGKSMQKWMTYNGQLYIGPHHDHERADAFVLVEDPLSYYKARWALRHVPGVDVYSALGTRVRAPLKAALLRYKKGLVFFDGDLPGVEGGAQAAASMRSLGVPTAARTAPEGMDPKDMEIAAIRDHVKMYLKE